MLPLFPLPSFPLFVANYFTATIVASLHFPDAQIVPCSSSIGGSRLGRGAVAPRSGSSRSTRAAGSKPNGELAPSSYFLCVFSFFFLLPFFRVKSAPFRWLPASWEPANVRRFGSCSWCLPAYLHAFFLSSPFLSCCCFK